MNHEATVDVVRAAILAADPRIGEEIKWNAPSFHIGGAHFATFNLRGKTAQLVMHLGAKSKPDATVRGSVPDPESLLAWKSADRGIITFRDDADARAKGAAVTAIVNEWIKHV